MTWEEIIEIYKNCKTADCDNCPLSIETYAGCVCGNLDEIEKILIKEE